jgi:hypothetical protein
MGWKSGPPGSGPTQAPDMAGSAEMAPAGSGNFLQPPVDSHKLRFPARFEFAYGVTPAGNTKTYTFIPDYSAGKQRNSCSFPQPFDMVTKIK